MRALSKKKEHTFDINASRLIFKILELHSQLVHIVAMYCTHVVSWEGIRWLKTSVVLHLMLHVTICKRFGVMCVLFPWICANIMCAPVRCIVVQMEAVRSRDSNSHSHNCGMDCMLLLCPCAVCFSFLHEQTGQVGGTPRLQVPFSCRGSVTVVDSSPTWRSGPGRRRPNRPTGISGRRRRRPAPWGAS